MKDESSSVSKMRNFFLSFTEITKINYLDRHVGRSVVGFEGNGKLC